MDVAELDELLDGVELDEFDWLLVHWFARAGLQAGFGPGRTLYNGVVTAFGTLVELVAGVACCTGRLAAAVGAVH